MKRNILIALFVLSSLFFVYKPIFSQADTEYFDQANSMLVSGNNEKAVELYKQAIESNSNFAEAYLGLGMAYKEESKYTEAYNATKKALELKPKYYQAYYNLGLILEKQNKFNEAINAYNKFLDKVQGADKFSDVAQRLSRLEKMSR